MRRAIASTSVSLCAALLLAADAVSQGKAAGAPSGEFAFAGNEQCTYASAFGPPPVLQATGTVTTQTSTLQGMLTLAPDGTGRLVGRIASLQSVPSSGATPAMQSTLACDVRHTLGADGELQVDRTCRGTRLRGTGSETAQTWTASRVRETGQAGAGEMIVLTDTQVAVESLSIAGVSFSRICLRTSWLTRSKEKASAR